MAAISVSTVIPVVPALVWEELRHIERHVDWMSDAESIRLLTEATEGVGVRFECLTKVGPLRLNDQMEVTEWRDGEVMGVKHSGLVSGWGRFQLAPVSGPDGKTLTKFEWSEELHFRWWMGGPLTAILAVPVLRLIWKRNLASFAARFGPSP